MERKHFGHILSPDPKRGAAATAIAAVGVSAASIRPPRAGSGAWIVGALRSQRRIRRLAQVATQGYFGSR